MIDFYELDIFNQKLNITQFTYKSIKHDRNFP